MVDPALDKKVFRSEEFFLCWTMTNASLSFRIGKNYHTVRYLNNQSQPLTDTPFTESGLFLLGIGGFGPSSKSILSVIYYSHPDVEHKIMLENNEKDH
jgi:hypothetical protein